MSKGKHRKPPNWRLRYMSGLVAVALTVITACAAASPSPSQAQETPKTTDWKPTSVQGVDYACDPAFGVFVRHQWSQNGIGLGQENWTLALTPISQLTGSQLRELCGRDQ